MKIVHRLMLLVLGAVLSVSSLADEYSDALNTLIKGNFKEKAKAVEVIAASGNEQSVVILESMLEGNLFYRRSDNLLGFAELVDKKYNFKSLDGTETEEGLGKRKVKKVSVNNSLRKQLRGLIAGLQLISGTKAQRKDAALNMLSTVDESMVPLLNSALKQEKENSIKKLLMLNIAMVDIDSNDEKIWQPALSTLRSSLESDVRNKLVSIQEVGPEEKQQAITDALQSIEGKVNFYGGVENIFFGLSLGSVLLLAAVGLAITFGVMGVINMAHGEMIMLGAYTTFVIQTYVMPNWVDGSVLVAIPVAFMVTGAFGILIERTVIRYLYGRPLETLLATFGLSLILQQLVRTVFSPLNQSVATPSWMSGSWAVNGALSLTYNRLYIIGFSLLVFIGLIFLLRRTYFGLQMRAVTQNRPMASSMGIRTGWVDALTFGLGSGVAGIAGVALSQLTNVGPNLGQGYIIDSFMVVVFGGVGNLWGTLVAAFSLGVVNKFLEPVAGAVLAKILVLIFIILFIQKRPRGMFALKGRAVDG